LHKIGEANAKTAIYKLSNEGAQRRSDAATTCYGKFEGTNQKKARFKFTRLIKPCRSKTEKQIFNLTRPETNNDFTKQKSYR
jgi:hypothetical protein